jgi:cell division protein FtsI (penicillin-binding protein 3)
VEVKRDILWRVYLSFIGIVLLGFVVLGRAFYIQQIQGHYWRSMSDSMHQKFVELDAERGTIYSEDGQMLSTSVPYFDVYMDFGADGLREKNGKRFKENIDSFSVALANYFNDKTSSEYKQELKQAYNENNRYYLLKKDLSFQQYKEFRDFPLVRLGRNKSGVIVDTKTKRYNPFGLLARRTIGLARENAQNVGLERTYDTLLKGTTGKRLVRFIAGGGAVPVEGYEIDPENGKDIITTIDVNAQDVAENALMKVLVQSESQYGTCIVMETKSGKIRAIANLGRRPDGTYTEDLNYALHATEPGSTIKLATLLSVLQEGSSKIDDLVEVGSTGSAYVGVRNVNDAERAPKPVLNVRECFAHSSNVGMSKLALKAFGDQPDKFGTYLHRYHLDTKIGVGLVGEGKPVLPKLKRTKEGLHAMLTASFGYALQVTPLHTLMLYNAIANDGKMIKPFLVSSIKSDGDVIKEIGTEVVEESICRPDVVKAAKSCMEAVVTEGTAKDVFKNYPIAVAGKTGTAHVAGGPVKYSDGIYQASFVGYFPADEPAYTCIVVIKTKPHAPIHFGGQLAAPVFKEVATKLYAMYVEGKRRSLLTIPPDSTVHSYAGNSFDIRNVLNSLKLHYNDSAAKSNWGSANTYANKVVVKSQAVTKGVMPDLRNMNLRDALYVLEDMDLKVSANGKGKVVAQNIAPGFPVNKDQKVILVLN